jgi:hypothetical protein
VGGKVDIRVKTAWALGLRFVQAFQNSVGLNEEEGKAVWAL